MSDCIEWPALGRHGFGYGMMHVPKPGGGRRTEYAHRAAWIAEHGPIPDGLFVLHRCDNPPCYNVEHLFLGTQADNMLDMAGKGRSRRGTRSNTNKLTEADVMMIVDLLGQGWDRRRLSVRFGVTPENIDHIRRGTAWSWLTGRKPA